MAGTARDEHWEQVYLRRDPHGVSWYRPHLDISLRMIRDLDLPTDAHIVDAGGGASTLVDDLLDDGFEHLTVIDLSPTALAISRARLGRRASRVRWLTGDLRDDLLPAEAVDLWHDRAVFHFLNDAADRDAYVKQLRRVVPRGGHVLVGTFAPGGPEQCSELPVTRYDIEALTAAVGAGFTRVAQAQVQHRTPTGVVQPFTYGLFRRH